MLDKLKSLRKELHQFPEVSGNESQTAERIKAFIMQNSRPTQILEGLGGNGLAVVYEISSDGPVIAVRCELDALPITEKNGFAHRSKNQGVSHKCGHDGHMAIVAGLTLWLREQQLSKGKIVLVFQPAEETGKGAARILGDTRFQALKIEYVFALHNIPGYPLHSILVPQNGFSAEVLSFALHLKGKESHASEPDKGINPAHCLAEAIQRFDALNINDPENPNYKILTPIYMHMGEKSYGISPALGELHYTVRTWHPETMETLRKEIENICYNISKSNSIMYSLDWFEHFPASLNDAQVVALVTGVAHKNGFNVIEKSVPFSFGEDFGWFSINYRATMFGVGAGENVPALHHADYDFPDALISTGIEMFKSIIQEILKE
ncbi:MULTISPECIES: amidohydrolase [Maribacter]|uniref:Amidohydrolase n=1 Tax=Maribacter flavus TaxID=1658664 RepID=A0ABU7IL22_9FLAO|nr:MULTISPECIES: amidohydrolase [Maribacter]MDC6405939.1 amidohydrolase [Maribacter sp. PR66]MEE1973276.1 amidohydrolase [Maribacter flavus]